MPHRKISNLLQNVLDSLGQGALVNVVRDLQVLAPQSLVIDDCCGGDYYNCNNGEDDDDDDSGGGGGNDNGDSNDENYGGDEELGETLRIKYTDCI
jgi:hypothetical protein